MNKRIPQRQLPRITIACRKAKKSLKLKKKEKIKQKRDNIIVQTSCHHSSQGKELQLHKVQICGKKFRGWS